ncbi:MAG TPA: MFS transporter [Solirubrobacterales bacterium]|nr:MFS transporter [Solirubrobacterales bacterium]
MKHEIGSHGELEEPDDRSRWIALYVLCAGMLMIVLDATVVNVALPTIQDDLGFSTSNLAWVVNGYLIAFGSLLLLAGRLGDLIGRRNIFLAGLTLFTVASLACGLAQNQEMLIIARFLQGVGGAMTSAVILGMIVTMFPDAREQAKAIGIFAFVASGGGSVGLLAGGVLTQSFSWHWIFFINIPIGVGTYLAARRLLKNDRGIGFDKGADFPGAILITSALMLGVYTIVKPAAEDGWGAGTTLGLGALTFLLLGAFILREATARTPLIPLRIFRNRNVSGANVIQALAGAGMFGVFFLGALYVQRILGYDALETGLAFMPTTIAMGTLSVKFSEPLIMRYGPRTILIPGLILIAAALALFTRAPVDGDYWVHVAPVMALMGLGAGLAFPALMNLAMSSATPEDAGLASGLVNTTAQVGAAVGLALLATLSASRSDNLIADGISQNSALTDGYHFAFWVAAGLVGLGVLISIFVIRPTPAPGPESAVSATSESGDDGELPMGDPAYSEGS